MAALVAAIQSNFPHGMCGALEWMAVTSTAMTKMVRSTPSADGGALDI
jgi:hypothetical protein